MAVSVRGCVTNWGPDATTGGVLLSVVVLDAHGEPVAVDGDLIVKLLGDRQRRSSRRRLGELTRWAQLVRQADFRGSPPAATYRLAFRGLDPVGDVSLGADAVLTASLGVRGVGRLADSAPLRLRGGLDPLRDRLQLATGRRRFAGEYQQRRRRSSRDYSSLPLTPLLGP